MTTLAVIPVKAASVRLGNKNRTQVGGVSLVGRAVNVGLQARELGLVDEVLISYDHWVPGLSEFAGRKDLTLVSQVALMPTRTLEVVQQVIANRPNVDLVALLLPTSPLRTIAHLVQSRLLLTDAVELVMSVTPFWQDVRYALTEERGLLGLTDANSWEPDVTRSLLKHDGTRRHDHLVPIPALLVQRADESSRCSPTRPPHWLER